MDRIETVRVESQAQGSQTRSEFDPNRADEADVGVESGVAETIALGPLAVLDAKEVEAVREIIDAIEVAADVGNQFHFLEAIAELRALIDRAARVVDERKAPSW